MTKKKDKLMGVDEINRGRNKEKKNGLLGTYHDFVLDIPNTIKKISKRLFKPHFDRPPNQIVIG